MGIDHNISQNSKRAQQDSVKYSINTNPADLTQNVNIAEMWYIQTTALVRQFPNYMNVGSQIKAEGAVTQTSFTSTEPKWKTTILQRIKLEKVKMKDWATISKMASTKNSCSSTNENFSNNMSFLIKGYVLC